MIEKTKKLYRFALPTLKILESNITRKRIPIRLDLNVTKYCNLRCKYCYVDFDALEEHPERSAQEWKDLLTDFHKRGTRAVRIMGGEPLIRKDIGEIIDHCLALGLVTEINTNGYLVKQRIDTLKKLDSVCISLDGTREANDFLRGKGCHDKVIEAIETCQANGITVRLHGMMTNNTLDSLDYMAELAKKYDVSFTCAPACLPDIKQTHPELYVPPDRAKAFYRKYLQMKRDGHRILNSTPAILHMIHWPFEDKLIHNKFEDWPRDARPFVRCQFGHRSCYIDADGMMYACSWQWGLGMNYFEHGFEKCWQYLEDNLSCVTCNTVNDFSYAFRLHPSIALEVVKEVLHA